MGYPSYDLTLDRYQERAKATAIYPAEHGLNYCLLKLNGEAGECAEAYGKFLRGDFDIEILREKLQKELGDVLWYVSQAALELDTSLEAIANMNLAKLKSRQDRGVLSGSGDSR